MHDHVIVTDQGEGGRVGVVEPLPTDFPVQPGDLRGCLLPPLLRNFAATVPKDLEEAAAIDGTDTAKFTLPLYVQYFYGQNSTDWGAIMASSTLFTIPVLAFFLLTQRRLASGLVAGAVKG